MGTLRQFRSWGLRALVGLALGILFVACAPQAMPAPEPTEAPAEAIPTEGLDIEATEEPGIPPASPPTLLERRMLVLEYPPGIRAGDSDVVRLTLEVDDRGNITPTAELDGNVTEGEVIEFPDLFETHNVLAQARLDMAGMEVRPSGEISEPLRPGQSVTFYWSLRPEDVGNYRGTVWFYLTYIPLDGSPESRQALSSQVIEIQATSFFGMDAGTARVAGLVGTALGSVLGMPFFEEALRWLWRRMKRQPVRG